MAIPDSRAAAPPPTSVDHWAGIYFRDLGDSIRAAWREGAGSQGFDRVAFAALQAAPPPRPIDAAAIVAWATALHQLPPQVNFHFGFGQPPLVVYSAPGFFLEVIFWFPSRTAIHGHGFSGAFRVLSGCSVQGTFTFEAREELADGLLAGELRGAGVELLEPGAVCQIEADDRFIHCVAHLGHPSLTLVARTTGDAAVGHQYTYYRCGAAHATHHQKRDATRQLAVLAALARSSPAAAAPAWREFLLHQDATRQVTALTALLAQPPAAWRQEVLAWCQSRWPSVASLAQQLHEEDLRQTKIYGSLGTGLLREPRAQLEAVLAEMFGSMTEAHRLVAASWPQTSPDATLAAWATRLPPLRPAAAGNTIPASAAS